MESSMLMNYELLTQKAKDVRTLKGEHDEVMIKITNLIHALNEIWTGDAQTTFVTKFDSMKPTFDQFAQTLEEYAQLMEYSAVQMRQQEEQVASTIRNA